MKEPRNNTLRNPFVEEELHKASTTPSTTTTHNQESRTNLEHDEEANEDCNHQELEGLDKNKDNLAVCITRIGGDSQSLFGSVCMQECSFVLMKV